MVPDVTPDVGRHFLDGLAQLRPVDQASGSCRLDTVNQRIALKIKKAAGADGSLNDI